MGSLKKSWLPAWEKMIISGVETCGASHQTCVSAEWPSLIGESANQLKNGNVFRTKILDQDRAKDCTTTTTTDIHHNGHLPHQTSSTQRDYKDCKKNIWIRISRTIRTT